MSNGHKNSGLGDCFKVGADLVVGGFGGTSNALKDLRELTLVHGIVAGQGSLEGYRFTHAWVEGVSSDGIPVVVDRSNGQALVIPQALYYLVGRIHDDEVERYTSDEARDRLLDFRHYGPWDGAPKAHIDPKPEEVKNYDRKSRSAA
jgi:hypothetical protein